MPTLLPSLPDVSGHLLRAGIPVTAQRLAIARVLLPLPVHLSAEQVQQCAPLHQRLVARHGVQHPSSCSPPAARCANWRWSRKKPCLIPIPSHITICITALPAS